MLSFLGFAFYFIVLLLLLHKMAGKHAPLTFRQTALVFSFKVLMGCLYGYIFLHYYHGDDTWNFFNDSLGEYQKMIHYPGVFFRDFLPGDDLGQAHHFSEAMSFYLRDLEYWLMVKLLALFNFFSRGNYYIDVVFFDFLVFWGPVLLFKLLITAFPGKKHLLLIVIFFIPPFVFWLSGIRAEGLLLLFIGLILFYTGKWFDRRKAIYFVWVMLAFAGFFIFRLQFLLIFIPAFVAWTLSGEKKGKAIAYFVTVYLLAIGIFFGSTLISSQKNLAAPLVKRQQEFFSLHGNTRFRLDSLSPSIPGFMKVLPQAAANTFIRPFVWEAKGPLQWLAALEIIACWILLIGLFVFPVKNWRQILSHPLILLFLFYGISQILLTGFVVPFPGAIVRYKVIPELMLVAAISLAIDWRKLNYKNK